MQLFLHLEQVEQGWGSVGHRSSAVRWTNVSSYESSILSPTAVSSSSLSISDCSTDKNAWTHQAQPAFKLNPWKDRQARAWAVSKATSVWIQSSRSWISNGSPAIKAVFTLHSICNAEVKVCNSATSSSQENKHFMSSDETYLIMISALS